MLLEYLTISTDKFWGNDGWDEIISDDTEDTLREWNSSVPEFSSNEDHIGPRLKLYVLNAK